jgi:hypothetical protein
MAPLPSGARFLGCGACVRLPTCDAARRDAVRHWRCVELRALCNDAPRTPPGPEGSNGTGITACAAEYPKFLSSFFCFWGETERPRIPCPPKGGR